MSVSEQLNESNREKLDSYYKSTNISNSCSILAQWVLDFLPVQLLGHREEIVQMIYASISQQFSDSNIDEVTAISEYLKTHSEEIKKLLNDELVWIGEGQDSTLQKLQPLFKAHLESLLLKVFVNRINGKQNESVADHAKFKTTAFIKLVDKVSSHFIQIGQIKKNHKYKSVDQIGESEMLNGFGANLHKGVLNTAEASEARITISRAKKEINANLRIIKNEKEQQNPNLDILQQARSNVKKAKADIVSSETLLDKNRKEHFFNPLSLEFLKLIDIDGPDKLDLPKPIAEELWEALKDRVLPKDFLGLHKIMMNPHTMNKLLITALDAINETVDGIDNGEININFEKSVPIEDSLQRKMNTACGNLTSGITGMMRTIELPQWWHEIQKSVIGSLKK